MVGADTMEDVCKPDPAAFAAAIRKIGADPSRTAMFEDSVKNLKTAKALGMTTVLITGPTALEEGATSQQHLQHCDAVVSKLCKEEIQKVLPNLWLPLE